MPEISDLPKDAVPASIEPLPRRIRYLDEQAVMEPKAESKPKRVPLRKSRLPMAHPATALLCPFCRAPLDQNTITQQGALECPQCWNVLSSNAFLSRRAFHGRLVLDVLGHFVTGDEDWMELALASGAKLDLPQGWLHVIHPKDRELFATAWREFVLQEARMPGCLYLRRLRLRLWLLQAESKAMTVTMKPLRNPLGELIGYEILWREHCPISPRQMIAKLPQVWLATGTVALFAISVLWLVSKGNKAEPSSSQTAVQAPPADAMDRVKAALLDYLAAPTMEDKASHVRGGEAMLEEMTRHSRLRQEPKIVRFGSNFPRLSFHGRSFYQGMAEDEKGELHSFAVEQIDGRYLLDWKSWVGFSDIGVKELLATQPTAPMTCRLLAKPTSYYNFGYEEAGWFSFSLSDGADSEEIVAYAPRDSAAGQALDAFLRSRPKNRPYRVTVRLAFEQRHRDRNQVRLVEFLEQSWLDAEAHLAAQ